MQEYEQNAFNYRNRLLNRIKQERIIGDEMVKIVPNAGPLAGQEVEVPKNLVKSGIDPDGKKIYRLKNGDETRAELLKYVDEWKGVELPANCQHPAVFAQQQQMELLREMIGALKEKKIGRPAKVKEE